MSALVEKKTDLRIRLPAVDKNKTCLNKQTSLD